MKARVLQTLRAVLTGSFFSMFVLFPNFLQAYKWYVKGFYLVLGLPFP